MDASVLDAAHCDAVFGNHRPVATCIDCDVGGEPARIVVAGGPQVEGESMLEKLACLKANHEDFRHAIIDEPRGHLGMFGVLVTPACTAGADAGAIFMDSGGYLRMCGHATIGLVTVLASIKVHDKKKKGADIEAHTLDIVIDTPAGRISTEAHIARGGSISSVSFVGTPSFVPPSTDHPDYVTIDERKIRFRIAHGSGSYFCLVDLAKTNNLGDVSLKNMPNLTDIGLKMLQEVNQAVTCINPITHDRQSIDLVKFYTDLPADENSYRCENLVVFGNGQYDRSPCGTGTSAKMALLKHDHGKGSPNRLESYSISGSKFVAEVQKQLSVKLNGLETPAVIVRITGTAGVIGVNRLYLDSSTEPVSCGTSRLIIDAIDGKRR